MNDDFNDRRMQLIAVAHRRRAALDIADVAAFIGHQNGAFKLAGFFGVDTEIGRQLHRAADALRHIDKGAVRSHRGVQRGKEVVIARHYGPKILFHQFRMIVDRLAERTEDDPLLGQLFAVGGRHRHRVEYRVHGHLAPFTYRHAQLVKGFFHLAGQKGIGPGLLHRARLGGAGLIAVAAGGGGIVAVILIIQLIVMRFQPVRLLHFQPRPVGIQTKLQHPLRLIAASRDSPNDFFINAFGQLIGLQASKKALFVVERAAGPGFDIVSCFSITRHSYSACTPKLSPQPHSCCAFGL